MRFLLSFIISLAPLLLLSLTTPINNGSTPFNGASLVTSEPPGANQYAVRVDVGRVTTTPTYSPSSPTAVTINAPYVINNPWFVMNRTWDVVLGTSVTPYSVNHVRSFFSDDEYNAINTALQGAGAVTLMSKSELTMYKLKNLSSVPSPGPYSNSNAALMAYHAAIDNTHYCPLISSI